VYEKKDGPEQPEPVQDKKRARTAGGVLVGLGLLAAKFKTLLFFAPKLLLSFGSMFLSIWFYALAFGGWKIGVVFVLMILVHELGHYLTWRNFGVAARLPMFIPGLGAFTSAPPTGTPAQNTAAALAGPLFGVGAAAVCWAYGISTKEPFWFACAYIGFFINLLNLIPTPPFDGGAIAGAIDSRLYLLGIAIFVGWIVFFGGFSVFSVLILILVLFTAIPRAKAVLQGRVDPHGYGLTAPQRVVTAFAYIALIIVAVAGAAATHIDSASATQINRFR
jgi:Zn-dependent protease